MNDRIADGLARTGAAAVAGAIARSSPDLIRQSGLAEFYDPHRGAGLGGKTFTRTAAMGQEFPAAGPGIT